MPSCFPMSLLSPSLVVDSEATLRGGAEICFSRTARLQTIGPAGVASRVRKLGPTVDGCQAEMRNAMGKHHHAGSTNAQQQRSLLVSSPSPSGERRGRKQPANGRPGSAIGGGCER